MLRLKAVELIWLLKTGKMDCARQYLSVAVQHKLNCLKPDGHINLGNCRIAPFYRRARVKVSGKNPGTSIARAAAR